MGGGECRWARMQVGSEVAWENTGQWAWREGRADAEQSPSLPSPGVQPWQTLPGSLGVPGNQGKALLGPRRPLKGHLSVHACCRTSNGPGGLLGRAETQRGLQR